MPRHDRLGRGRGGRHYLNDDNGVIISVPKKRVFKQRRVYKSIIWESTFCFPSSQFYRTFTEKTAV